MVTIHLKENEGPRMKLEPYKQRLQCASLAGCIELAREWLTRCRNSHAECEETSKSEFNYPMRLIDIAGVTRRLGSDSQCDEIQTRSPCGAEPLLGKYAASQDLGLKRRQICQRWHTTERFAEDVS